MSFSFSNRDSTDFNIYWYCKSHKLHYFILINLHFFLIHTRKTLNSTDYIIIGALLSMTAVKCHEFINPAVTLHYSNSHNSSNIQTAGGSDITILKYTRHTRLAPICALIHYKKTCFTDRQTDRCLTLSSAILQKWQTIQCALGSSALNEWRLARTQLLTLFYF